MSTAKKIVQDLSDLVGSVDDLLQTETAKQAPAIATELGAETQLNQAIDFLHGLLDQIKTALAAIRDPLLYVEALSGVLGLIEPFVNAIAQLTDASAEQLAKTGLNEVVKVTGPVSDAVKFSGKILQGGQQVLDDVPSMSDLDALLTSLQELAQTLLDRKALATQTVSA